MAAASVKDGQSQDFFMKPSSLFLREAKPGGFLTGGFPTFSGKVQIVSRTLSGLFLVGAVNRPRKRERTNRENPGESPDKSGKSRKDREKSQKQKKKDKRGRTSPDRETQPRLNPPRLAALDRSF